MLRCLVMSALFTSCLCDLQVLLLHTNDMHARYQQTDKYSGICGNDTDASCYGGFARLKAVTTQKMQEAKDKGWNTIYLNAGDTFQGTPYYTFFKWPMAQVFVDMLGLQVMSLGNHEFDDGIAGLAPYIGNVSVPIVCANLNTTLEPSMNQPNLTPSYILDVNGTKVGVIGYLTPDTKLLSNTGKLDILDEITSIRAEAQRLKSQNIPILIALGHSGYTKDQEIAKEVEELDLVVGGHSHSFLYSGSAPDSEVPVGPYPTVVTQASGKQVPVVQAYYATKYLGYLELIFNDAGNLTSWNGLPILLSGNLTQDADILSKLKPYEESIDTKIKAIIGYTDVLLDNNDMKCKLGECNIGNLITDAYVDYVTRHLNATEGWTVAAVGLQGGDLISGSIYPNTSLYSNGSITVEDLVTVLPWDGTVAVIQISGSVLLETLEFSVHRYEETITGHVSEFLQVSGIHVHYDLTRPSGDRVVSVEVLCAECDVPMYQPLNLTKIYGVVVPQYMEGGGDGFTMLTVPEPVILDKGDYEIVAAYIESHTPVNPVIEGRILLTQSKSSAPSVTSSFFSLCIALLACYVMSL